MQNIKENINKELKSIQSSFNVYGHKEVRHIMFNKIFRYVAGLTAEVQMFRFKDGKYRW
jgi:hypothetical protein